MSARRRRAAASERCTRTHVDYKYAWPAMRGDAFPTRITHETPHIGSERASEQTNERAREWIFPPTHAQHAAGRRIQTVSASTRVVVNGRCAVAPSVRSRVPTDTTSSFVDDFRVRVCVSVRRRRRIGRTNPPLCRSFGRRSSVRCRLHAESVVQKVARARLPSLGSVGWFSL